MTEGRVTAIGRRLYAMVPAFLDAHQRVADDRGMIRPDAVSHSHSLDRRPPRTHICPVCARLAAPARRVPRGSGDAKTWGKALDDAVAPTTSDQHASAPVELKRSVKNTSAHLELKRPVQSASAHVELKRSVQHASAPVELKRSVQNASAHIEPKRSVRQGSARIELNGTAWLCRLPRFRAMRGHETGSMAGLIRGGRPAC